MTPEQHEALKVLQDHIRTDEFKSRVREGIAKENKRFGMIERASQPTREQLLQVFDI